MTSLKHLEGDPKLPEANDIGQPGGPHTKPHAPNPDKVELDELRARCSALQKRVNELEQAPNVGNSKVEG